jgi:hypothetical protein
MHRQNETVLKKAASSIKATIEIHQHRQNWTHECETKKHFILPQTFTDIIHTTTVPTIPYTTPKILRSIYNCTEPMKNNNFNIFNSHNFNDECTLKYTNTRQRRQSATSSTSFLELEEDNDQNENAQPAIPNPHIIPPTAQNSSQRQQTLNPLSNTQQTNTTNIQPPLLTTATILSETDYPLLSSPIAVQTRTQPQRFRPALPSLNTHKNPKH